MDSIVKPPHLECVIKSYWELEQNKIPEIYIQVQEKVNLNCYNIISKCVYKLPFYI